MTLTITDLLLEGRELLQVSIRKAVESTVFVIQFCMLRSNVLMMTRNECSDLPLHIWNGRQRTEYCLSDPDEEAGLVLSFHVGSFPNNGQCIRGKTEDSQLSKSILAHCGLG